jgi:4-hydroxy-tetrahydrodipicolinate reductase
MPNIGVIGADGRLGSRIVRAATDTGATVGLRGTRGGWIGDVPDVVVDVSSASALSDVVDYCRKHGVPLLSATSGLTQEDRAALRELSAEVGVLRADNLSLGNYLQRSIATALGPFLDRLHAERLGSVSIVDRHPAYKVDRPSATALALRDRLLAGVSGAIEVGVDSVRAGMPVCEHDVRLSLGDEEVVVQHAVRDWAAYSTVAVRAALWLADRDRPSLHTMDDFYSWLLASSLILQTGKG